MKKSTIALLIPLMLSFGIKAEFQKKDLLGAVQKIALGITGATRHVHGMQDLSGHISKIATIKTLVKQLQEQRDGKKNRIKHIGFLLEDLAKTDAQYKSLVAERNNLFEEIATIQKKINAKLIDLADASETMSAIQEKILQQQQDIPDLANIISNLKPQKKTVDTQKDRQEAKPFFKKKNVSE